MAGDGGDGDDEWGHIYSARYQHSFYTYQKGYVTISDETSNMTWRCVITWNTLQRDCCILSLTKENAT